MNSYELLSEIYRILGQIDRSVIIAAKKQNIAPNIKKVLDAFAAASSKDQAPKMEHVPTRVPFPRSAEGKVVPSRHDSVEWRQNVGFATGDVARVLDRLALVSPQLTNRRLIKLLNRSGLQIRSRVRESRRKMLARVIHQLRDLPEERRLAIIRRLQSLMGVDETSGWMNIIRSSSRE